MNLVGKTSKAGRSPASVAEDAKESEADNASGNEAVPFSKRALPPNCSEKPSQWRLPVSKAKSNFKAPKVMITDTKKTDSPTLGSSVKKGNDLFPVSKAVDQNQASKPTPVKAMIKVLMAPAETGENQDVLV